jgi:hypothetical protein
MPAGTPALVCAQFMTHLTGPVYSASRLASLYVRPFLPPVEMGWLEGVPDGFLVPVPVFDGACAVVELPGFVAGERTTSSAVCTNVSLSVHLWAMTRVNLLSSSVGNMGGVSLVVCAGSTDFETMEVRSEEAEAGDPLPESPFPADEP